MNKLVLLAAFAISMVAAQVQAQQVRNSQDVIRGAFARSGTTNQRAFDDSTLVSLCNQGYTYVVYVYAGGRNGTVTCGGGRTLTYVNNTNWKDPSAIIRQARSAIDKGGKVLIHCWNGIHASKYVGAVALVEFCGFSGAQAKEFFVRGIRDGEISSRDSLAAKLGQLRNSGGGVISGCPSAR